MAISAALGPISGRVTSIAIMPAAITTIGPIYVAPSYAYGPDTYEPEFYGPPAYDGPGFALVGPGVGLSLDID
jgi:hypothetical protein